MLKCFYQLNMYLFGGHFCRPSMDTNVQRYRPFCPHLAWTHFPDARFTCPDIKEFYTFSRTEFLAAFWNVKAFNLVRHHPLTISNAEKVLWK